MYVRARKLRMIIRMILRVTYFHAAFLLITVVFAWSSPLVCSMKRNPIPKNLDVRSLLFFPIFRFGFTNLKGTLY